MIKAVIYYNIFKYIILKLLVLLYDCIQGFDMNMNMNMKRKQHGLGERENKERKTEYNNKNIASSHSNGVSNPGIS